MAALEVSAGIRHFNKTGTVEVIIVARGGGSAEDLAAFNHEGLARAIAASKIPVISAVGHETDFTIVDFVADLRAATPSAAAEMVIRSRQDIEELSESLRQRLERAMRYRLLIGKQHLTELAQHGAFRRMTNLINQRQQRVDELVYRLEKAERQTIEQQRRRWESASAAVRHYDVRRILSGIRKELDARVGSMVSAARTRLLEQRIRLQRLEGQMEALSPLAVLDRGYALVFDSHGQLVKDAAQLQAGNDVTAQVARGRFIATVKKTIV